MINIEINVSITPASLTYLIQNQMKCNNSFQLLRAVSVEGLRKYYVVFITIHIIISKLTKRRKKPHKIINQCSGPRGGEARMQRKVSCSATHCSQSGMFVVNTEDWCAVLHEGYQLLTKLVQMLLFFINIFIFNVCDKLLFILKWRYLHLYIGACNYIYITNKVTFR